MRLSKEARIRRNRFTLFLALSLLVHIFFVFGFPRILPFLEPAIEQEPEALMVELQTPNLEQLAREEMRQIVNSEKTNNTETPKEKYFLGERNQTADKQSRARTVERFSEGGGDGSGKTAEAKQLSLKSLTPQHQISGKPDDEGDQVKEKPRSQQQASLDKGGAKASANSDFLDDVKEGDKTLLSTKEFVYFGYYNRIRSKLEQAWNSRLREVFMQSGWMTKRALASNQSFYTRVIVELDRHGRITAIQMLEQSGAKDLDQAAIEAFNRAGPFPDPPTGLIERDGKIRVPWGFHVST